MKASRFAERFRKRFGFRLTAIRGHQRLWNLARGEPETIAAGET